MNLDTITKGEELLKRATPGPWGLAPSTTNEMTSIVIVPGVSGDPRFDLTLTAGVNRDEIPTNDAELIVWLRNHASELLQCAREVEGTREHCQQLMDEIGSLQHEVKRLEEILDKPYQNI